MVVATAFFLFRTNVIIAFIVASISNSNYTNCSASICKRYNSSSWGNNLPHCCYEQQGDYFLVPSRLENSLSQYVFQAPLLLRKDFTKINTGRRVGCPFVLQPRNPDSTSMCSSTTLLPAKRRPQIPRPSWSRCSRNQWLEGAIWATLEYFLQSARSMPMKMVWYVRTRWKTCSFAVQGKYKAS